jgi:hypothetical protein
MKNIILDGYTGILNTFFPELQERSIATERREGIESCGSRTPFQAL